ncbi:hypothetical protein [Comamonas antarctica]|uniref:Uncharacterized protein n=1 Tax=Comamonas antarctica TaxID=2743470 RepID=A0A6N1X2X0_9BURK|nr:hypothetical protein [Comamonas antarctica]QKV52286.1 hypothetical protein HUK68_04860 [Comamonas antarctica]
MTRIKTPLQYGTLADMGTARATAWALAAPRYKQGMARHCPVRLPFARSAA